MSTQHLVGFGEMAVKMEAHVIVLEDEVGEKNGFALQVRIAGDIRPIDDNPLFQILPAPLQSQVITALEQYDKFGDDSIINTTEDLTGPDPLG